MANLWQQPYVNVFKHFQIHSWKKSTKEGEVESLMDKTLKATVYRISGCVPAGNYIQLPQTSTQSLALTGRYVYLLFKPTPAKHFVVHMDVATQDGLIVRISFSNLYKEFKSTSTWLQFPFVCHAASSTVCAASAQTSRDLLGAAPLSTRWTVLCLDMAQMLTTYLNRRYVYLKNVRLCANLTVRNIFTSDLLYRPGVTLDQAKRASKGLLPFGCAPMPREMAFPLSPSENWSDIYDYIRFPSEGSETGGCLKPFDSVQMATFRESDGMISQRMDGKTVYTNRPTHSDTSAVHHATQHMSHPTKRSIVKELPRVGVDENGLLKTATDGSSDVHVYAKSAISGISATKSGRSNDGNCAVEHPNKKKIAATDVRSSMVLPPRQESFKCLKPDPILRLRRIVGFSGSDTHNVLWNSTGSFLVYPCHNVVVAMQANNGHQKFFIGHTDKVSCICMNGTTTLLASGQSGAQSVVRVWQIQNLECLAVFKTHAHSLAGLSMSHSGSTLCGVGKDSHSKNLVVVWNISQINKGGQVGVMAKAHTDVDIECMQMAAFDDTRMVSCGRDNIRLWRIKNGALRSMPVNLGTYNSMKFTDCCFEACHEPTKDPLDCTVYACTKSGHVFEIDYRKVCVRQVRHLQAVNDLTVTTQGVRDASHTAVNTGLCLLCMCVNESFCVTGSDDGYVRLWPLDFKHILLEAHHDGPVTAVDISNDCLRVLAATTTGNIGILDISTRNYTTVMRSHVSLILSFAIDCQHKHIATVSSDHTIRVWDLDTLQQLYDFTAPHDGPCVIAYHPVQQVFACGFESGTLRVFNIATTTMIAEHRQHRGKVTGIAFSPTLPLLYNAGSLGSLAVHDTADNKYQLMRLLSNTVARGERRGANSLTVSADGRHVAFIGPTDFTISVVDGKTLDEVMRIDITSLNTADNTRTVIDSAILVKYSPPNVHQILVMTSANKLLKFDARNGRILAEVDSIHRSGCTSFDVTKDGRHLITAGDKVVKVWDYDMRLDINFQVFIGHGDSISDVLLTPDSRSLISVGEAIFIWDFLASETSEDPQPVAEGRAKAKNYYTGQNESLTFYSEHLSHHALNLSSTDVAPRQQQPQPFDADSLQFASGDAGNLSAITKADTEDLLGEDIVSDDQISAQCQQSSRTAVTADAKSHQNADKTSIMSLLPMNHDKPTVLKHFCQMEKRHALAQRRYAAPSNLAGLKIASVFGYNGNGRGNMIWHCETGFFAYTAGCVIVVEDLNSGTQRLLLGHNEEISTLALQNDCQFLASASGPHGLSVSQICIWDLVDMTCKHTLIHHKYDIVCLAYARDDRFLLSVGDYRECSIVLWSTHTYTILTCTTTKQPIHHLKWDPFTVDEFVSVGESGVLLFWLLDETQADVTLRVHEAHLPDNLTVRRMGSDVVHSTCLEYAGDSVLYVGSSNGFVSAWDTRRNTCFMHWQAGTDSSDEIDFLICRQGRLATLGKNVRLWSVVSVGEVKLAAQHSADSNNSMAGVSLEDEMTLDGPVSSVAFDDALDMGIVGTTAGTLWYINWVERASIRLISGHSSAISCMVVYSDEYLVTGSTDGGVRVWSIKHREQTLQFRVRNQACHCLALSPVLPVSTADCKQLPWLVAGYADGTLRLFDVNRIDMKLKMHPHAAAVTAVSFSGNGRMILSGGYDGVIAISNRTTGMTVRVLKDQQGAPVTGINIQPTGSDVPGSELWLAVSTDRRVSVWSADWARDSCELVDWLTFPAPAFTPDGTITKTMDDVYFRSVPPCIAQFSRDEPDIIVYTGYGLHKQIQFYSLSQCKVVRCLPLTDWVLTLDLSVVSVPLIAVGDNGRLVKLMDYFEGSFQDYIGHTGAVSHVVFSSTAKLMFSASDSELFMWNVCV